MTASNRNSELLDDNTDLLGADMLASASLIGPNTIQIIYLAEDQGVTEIQTHKFTAAGIEVLLHYEGK